MKIVRFVVICGVVVAGAAASLRSARATSDGIGFANATAWHFADRGCFYDGVHAAIWNTCDAAGVLTSRKVLLQLTNVAPDTVSTPAFYAAAADSGTGTGTLPQCRVIMNALDNSFIDQTNLATIGVAKTFVGGLLVNNAQYVTHFDCDLFGGRYGIAGAYRFDR